MKKVMTVFDLHPKNDGEIFERSRRGFRRAPGVKIENVKKRRSVWEERVVYSSLMHFGHSYNDYLVY